MLRDPVRKEGFVGRVTLRDQALSVSSSLSRSIRIGGRRYGQVIDPASGLPLESRRQAAVVAPSASTAEALSTALLIYPAGEGLGLIEGLSDVEALLVEADGERRASSGWRRVTGFAAVRGDSESLSLRGLPRRRTGAARSGVAAAVLARASAGSPEGASGEDHSDGHGRHDGSEEDGGDEDGLHRLSP